MNSVGTKLQWYVRFKSVLGIETTKRVFACRLNITSYINSFNDTVYINKLSYTKVLGPVKTQTFDNTIHLHWIQTLVLKKGEFCAINFASPEAEKCNLKVDNLLLAFFLCKSQMNAKKKNTHTQKWIPRPLLGYQFKVKAKSCTVNYFMAVWVKLDTRPRKMTKVMTSVVGIRHREVVWDNWF